VAPAIVQPARKSLRRESLVCKTLIPFLSTEGYPANIYQALQAGSNFFSLANGVPTKCPSWPHVEPMPGSKDL
jgi:hypothetical protein